MAQRQIVIHRTVPKETRIQNRLIWDDSISTSARFALIAMLSLPDTWDFSVRGMAAMLKISKDTMSKYMRELEKSGYLKRIQSHGEEGKFSSTQYILTDTPGDFGIAEPCPKNTDTEEPCPNLSAPVLSAPENQPQKKRTEEKKRTEQYPPKAPRGGRAPTEPSYRPDWFERFWALYPRKTNRVAAVKAWDKIQPDFDLCKTMAEAIQAQMRTVQWQEGPQHIPHPSTWLNNARWLDEIVLPKEKVPGGERVASGWR